MHQSFLCLDSLLVLVFLALVVAVVAVVAVVSWTVESSEDVMEHDNTHVAFRPGESWT